MKTFVLILWVLHHQLAIPGYTSGAACAEAAEAAKRSAGSVGMGSVINAYCIPGP